jgi:hypothetical protein
MEHKVSPFPHVAEAIQEALELMKGKEEEIKSMKSELGLGREAEEKILSNLSLADNMVRPTNAVSSLTEFLEKKRLIDIHCRLVGIGGKFNYQAYFCLQSGNFS